MRRLPVMMALALLNAGCSEAFNPTVTGPRPFGVFAVLHAGTDTQYVRLTQTSDPMDPAPKIQPIPNAVVTVHGPGGPFVYQPFVWSGAPGTADSIVEYRAAGFLPLRGGTYVLNVQTPSAVASATVVVPANTAAPISMRDEMILSEPHTRSLETPIVVIATLGNASVASMVRFLIEYEVNRNGGWEVERTEVPLVYANISSDEDPTPIYPTLTRRVNLPSIGGGLPPPETTFFTNVAYKRTIALIHARYGSPNLRMKRVLMVLMQSDRNFFTYYAFANSFEDRFTIRVDQPDYSNMIGALGIFGSVSTDTLVRNIPENLKPR